VDESRSVTEGAGPKGPVTRRPRFLNRYLSWLDFDARVLALAEDPELPLLERIKYLSIFGTNLDEFFQIRVADLDEQHDAGVTTHSPDGLAPSEQLRRVRDRARELMARADELYGDLRSLLREEGIEILDWDELDSGGRKQLALEFDESVFPVLTPLAVDPAHPFPYISNLSLNIGVTIADPDIGQVRFARVKVPAPLPRFMDLGDGSRFVPIEQVIAAHLSSLFPGMEIREHHLFRVTRNQDPDVAEDETEDIRHVVEQLLRERRRSSHAVRLELSQGTSAQFRDLLVHELDIEPGDVDEVTGLLDLGALWQLYRLPRPDLKQEEWESLTPRRLATEYRDVFAVMREGDVLVQHPYESFSASVGAFLAAAAEDPRVVAVKQTLYRTSGTDSGSIASLIRAAERGKQVVALVELTARFDEERNVTWAQELENAGVHVVYGVVGLKTHSKVSLVVREEEDGLRRYAHVGTGNYNSTTARVYEDVGLLTTDEDVTADVSDLFNFLTGYSKKASYRRLLVAPTTFRSGITELIRGQARQGGRIVIKVNHLADTRMIDALYEAGEAGADIDLVVRTTCCLVPGVPGMSERIRVRSFLGRYLEHSRIFRFGTEQDAVTYMGSGDLMPRNLDRRVEALSPILDPDRRADVDRMLDLYLSPDVAHWRLDAAGAWTRHPERGGRDVQRALMDLAVERSEASGR
jgi:polyphosphate kinase